MMHCCKTHNHHSTYLHVAFDQQRVRELVQTLRAVLTVQIDVILVHHVISAAAASATCGALLVSRHQHRLDGEPVHQEALERAATEARRLQVVLRHLGI